jgi:hydroxymethylbilane synthase
MLNNEAVQLEASCSTIQKHQVGMLDKDGSLQRRLGQAHRASEILDPSVWLPAAGAGTVIIEHRADDPATGELLAPLTHAPTRILLDAERAALAALHGGCLTAASAHATLDATSEVVTVHAAVLDPTGGDPLRACASGPSTSAHEVGQDAGQQLLDTGAKRLLGRPV